LSLQLHRRGLPHDHVQVATESNRHLVGWVFHPLVLCAFVAH